ncbi:MAG: YeeE/YedE family protein [Pseudomonadota bacterium]
MSVTRSSNSVFSADLRLPPPSLRVLAAAAFLLAVGAAYLALTVGFRLAALYGIGAVLGLVLYHATFGFAASWRGFLKNGKSAGLRAQVVMLALATAIFFPLLSMGELFGQRLSGAVAPLGLSVLVGAFLFGIGMQLAGACASGTLYTVGGGSTRMIITLIFFMIGSLIGTAHLPWWLSLQSFGSHSVLQHLGLGPALGLQLGVFLVFFWVFGLIEKGRCGAVEPIFSLRGFSGQQFLRGPWPLVIGAMGLALLNAATLALAGHPWTVSFGYTLWGAKIVQGLGLSPETWTFWQWSFPKQALAGSIFANTTSVMNLGILVGAFLAAGLAGRFLPVWRLPWKSIAAAVLGGILMGYGARLAFGCNIGAYFSGIASGSLHGWLWFASALTGSYLGLKVRPFFGLNT